MPPILAPRSVLRMLSIALAPVVLLGFAAPLPAFSQAGSDPCTPQSVTYTTDGDFNLGSLNGVVTNVNQLELSPAAAWPYAWIANAGEGTISKVNTQTGDEVARYYTGPPDINNNYPYLAPSRTVVDKDGNCWVANRTMSSGPASVTQFAAFGGIDWNNNNVIDTSFDANSNGQIDPWEILPWGQDERAIRHYQLGGAGEQARALCLDRVGFLWVGMTNASSLVKVSTTLPTATYAANNPPTPAPVITTIVIGGRWPYGLVLAPNGLMYLSTVSNRAYEIDPGAASGGTNAGPAVTEYIEHDGQNYGIAVDKNCIVWIALYQHPGITYGCVRWDPPLTAGNPLNGWTLSSPSAPGPGRGITVDGNNTVWMACNDANSSVVEISNTVNPVILNTYPTPSAYPIGVGIASDGNLIVTPGASSTWSKIDITNGSPIPLAGPELCGFGPYTYSDFTGNLQNMVGTQQGTWNVVTDAGSNVFVWNFIGWNQATPPLTSVIVEARWAQTLIALNTQSWTTIGAPGIQAPMVGRYIETRVRLQRVIEQCGEPFVTPILYDLTVAGTCDPCGFANCPPDTIIPCTSPSGAEFFYPTPVLSGICDSTFTITCNPPGNFFPIGTTQVQCVAVNANDDTLFCTFNVTVTGDCDPPPTGACCIRNTCFITTETDCENNGGIYFGDNTNCTLGCNRNCVVPPNNLVAWWPFNGSSGGITPNLAGPLTGGALVNGPGPVTGQHVVNSYSFDGVNDFINVPHHATLNMGAADLTLDAWIRTTQASGVATIMDKRGSAPIQGFAFFLFDGYPSLQLAVGGGFSNYILTNANGGPPAFVADNNWHFVAVTVDRDDPNGIQFYVDGAPVGTAFNPLSRQGNLNNTDPILIAQRMPALGGGFFAGDIDEVEIIRRELSPLEIDLLYEANVSGKCPETCYATQNAVCCNGAASNSAITICNYSLTSQTYSWGVSAINGGAGCAAFGPTAFSPTTGTVAVAAQSCLTIPIFITCPTNVPPGQAACYQVSIFNHQTGRLFGCQGSVARAKNWCFRGVELGDPIIAIQPILPGTGRTIQFQVTNVGEPGTGGALNYMIRALAGDTGAQSKAVPLNGLPPGEPVIDTIVLHGGETGTIEVFADYTDEYLIGYDRLVVSADVDGDGLEEMLGEVAVRAAVQGVSGVPGGPDTPTPVDDRLLLVFPNPFSANDQIRFRVDGDKPANVKLRLFDLMGRSVKTFYNEQDLPPGEHSVRWTAVDDRGARLTAGIYFLKLDIGKKSESVKIMVRP